MAKLVVIDDDKDTCEYLKEFFEQRKCVVFTAHSGLEGLSLIKVEKPEIVLLDVKMEGMNGLETLKEIKNFDPTMKVIIVTVAADEETRHKASELGADDFIKKPLNTAYLEGTVSLKVAHLALERRKKLLPKILVVDDEDDIRKTLVDHLSARIDCEIIQAVNGYEAIEKLNENDVDLVLLDIKMPGISGTEVIKKIKALPRGEEIPIIVLTKWDSSEVSKQVIDSGAEYIPKPFSLKIVRTKVEEKLKALGKFSAKQS